MDEENVGRLQARLLRLAMNRAKLTLAQVWWHYFSLGGDAVEMEVDAYLHDALHLPSSQRDLLAHAINELSGYEWGFVAPYTKDLLRSEKERGRDDGRGCPDEDQNPDE